MEEIILPHPYPVDGDNANSTLDVPLEDSDMPYVERLVTRKLSAVRHVICCVPGYVHNIALWDIVTLDKLSNKIVSVEPSGRWVFRIYSKDGWWDKKSLLDRIAEKGGLMETCSDCLIAIDVACEDSASEMALLLNSAEQSGEVVYETGKV